MGVNDLAREVMAAGPIQIPDATTFGQFFQNANLRIGLMGDFGAGAAIGRDLLPVTGKRNLYLQKKLAMPNIG